MSVKHISALIILALCGLFAYALAAEFLYAFLTNTYFSANPYYTWRLTLTDSSQHNSSALYVALGAPIVIAILIAGAIHERIRNSQRHFGAARWATVIDVSKAGLNAKSGVILGKFRGRYLISNNPTHIMVVAPTRSGKGVGLVVPNLLTWQGSLICLDVKHENYKKTAGYRQDHGQNVYMWSPMDECGHSHKYNPLDMVSSDPHQKVSDLQIIAKILIPDPPKSDPIWASEARALFVGLALYVMDNQEMPSTIGAVNRLLGTEADLGDVCRHIVKGHPEIASSVKKPLMNFANKAAKERSGVKSSLNQAINLWDNPLIDAATSSSDFLLSDLRKQKISIYVGVLTGQIETLTPLLRIFFEQVITKLSMKEPDENEPHHVLLMLDELHMLGKIDSMTTAFTLLAGYNCRVMGVVQSLNWLDVTYGKDKRNGILSCCAHQIFFATNDLDTAQYVSDSCGTQTIDTVSKSQRKSMKFEAPTQNTSQRGKPLIAKHELRDFPQNQQIILAEASKPIKACKIKYYEERTFKTRVGSMPNLPKLNIEVQDIPSFDIPTEEEKKAQKTKDPNQSDMFDKKYESIADTIPEEENHGEDVLELLSENLK